MLENKGNSEMRSVSFFNKYFSNLGALVLANLLFIPFDLLAAGVTALTYKLMGGINVIAASASFIILNVGMAGISLVCRYICEGKEFSVFHTFVKGIKENALSFLIHGAVFYAAFAVSYLSIMLYYSGTKTHGIFWVPLIITTIIAVGFLFASYYMNVMTVTLELSLKDTYRNCALFSFGEIKNNAIATVALIVLSAVVFSIAYIINNMWIVLLVLGIMQMLIIPSTIQYIITFYVYDDMIAILDKTRRTRKEDEDKSEKTEPEPIIDEDEAEDIARLTGDSKDEFIFYNGRMIKRSEVERMTKSLSDTDTAD